jgi:mono/diheme cytochrome c family protein
MPTLWIAVLFPMSLVVGLYAQNGVRSPYGVHPTDGSGIFQKYCASCHGVGAHGDGPAATSLKKKVPDLTRLSSSNNGSFPTLHVKTTILLGSDDLIPAHGSKQMPIWGPVFHEIEFDRDLGHVRLENVTRYLESIQQR